VNLLADANELVKALKKAARDEREASKPVSLFFGEVQSVDPLRINVEQKMVLGEKQLILARNVTDFKTMATVDWPTESGLNTHTHTVKGTDSAGDGIDLASDAVDLAHTHKIAGKKVITIHNGLAVGEEVILVRQQEGQKFVVIDRIGGRI